MIQISNVIDAVEQMAPSQTQESWDNSGVQVGDVNQVCAGAVLALDISMCVVDKAMEVGANLIITHHPLLFNPTKTVTPDTREGLLIIKLIQNNIVLYSTHTPIDKAEGGINTRLAEILGLSQIVPLDPVSLIGRVGMSEATTCDNIVDKLKGALPITTVRKSIEAKEMKFEKVAVCGGSGGSLIDSAIDAGAQVYITGDLKYSHFVEYEGRITLIDIGHFESEVQFCDILFSLLSNIFPNFAIQTILTNPFQ